MSMKPLFILALAFLASGHAASLVAKEKPEPLKAWNYTNLKEVLLSANEGNEVAMRLNPDVKTPDNQSALELNLKKLAADALPHAVQLKFVYPGSLQAGHSYELSFFCKGSVPGIIPMVVALSGRPWTAVPNASYNVEISSEWKIVKFYFTVKQDWNGPLAVPRFMLARFGAGTLYFGPAVLWDMAEKPSRQIQENLIFNSGFELGDAGYNCVRYLYPPNNPDMQYENAVVDRSTFVSGRQSLRIPNRFAEEIRLYPREVNLEPGTEYTCSFWAKADKRGTSVGVSLLASTSPTRSLWASHNKYFVADTAWKRFSFTFSTKPNAAFNPYLLYIVTGANPQAVPATIWIDDLQLDQGPEKPYESGSVLEAACLPEKNYYVSKDGRESVAATLTVSNNSKKNINAKVSVAMVDDYYQRTAFSHDFDLSLQAGETRNVRVDAPVNAYGSYLIETRLESPAGTKFRSFPGCFAIIGEYVRRDIDLDKDFCLGFNGPSMYFFTQLTARRGCFRATGSGREDYAKRLEMAGCRLLRDWIRPPRLFEWGLNEPEDGKYDFQWSDRAVNFYGRYGIQILPVLHPEFVYRDKIPSWFFPEPEWMIQMRKNGKKVSAVTETARSGDYRLVPIEKWRAYVRAVATHFKGRVTHYEITNEPNLFCPSAAIYVDFLNASFEEIRQADSKAKVVGFCVTGDMGGNVELFFRQCLEAGGLKYADIVSWHPYGARELSSIRPADKEIAKFKKDTAEFGRPDIPIWNTECFYLYGTAWVDTPPYKPHHAIRRLFTDLGEGVAQSMPVEEGTIWRDLITPEFKYVNSTGIRGLQFLPSSSYVAYNAFARFLERAKPIGKYRWGDSAVCYAYEREGEFLAAFWDYRERNDWRVKLPDHAGDIDLFDLFGNRIADNVRTVAIDPKPYYLKWKGGTRESVLAALSQAIVSGKDPIRVERALLLKGDTVLLVIRNISGKTIDRPAVSVSMGSSAGNIASSSAGAWRPMELREFEISLPAKIPGTGKINVKLTGTEKPFSCVQTVTPVKSIQLTGKHPSPAFRIEKPVIGKPASPDDLSASFDLARQGEDLLLKVKVRDDRRGRPSPKAFWDEDAIQIYLDAFPERTDSGYPAYAQTTYKIIVAAHRDGKSRVDSGGFPGQVGAEVKLLPDGYEADIRIPLAGIPGLGRLDGRRLGFDLSVEDSDAAARKTELVWNGTANNYQDRSGFGILEFDHETMK